MLFSLFIFIGQSLGPFLSGFISTHTTWRWIFWFQFIISCLSFLSMVLFLEESRGIVLLSRRASRFTRNEEQLGREGKVYRTSSEDERANIGIMIRFSLIRPVYFLFREVIVGVIALWVGTCWGIISLFIGSIKIVFEGYGWGYGQIGELDHRLSCLVLEF